MRKILLTTVFTAFTACNAFSQLSVAAGGTYSKWQDDFTSFRGGFNVGALYDVKSDSTPFCFEGGLLLMNRGANLDGAKDFNGGGEYNFRVSLYAVHVPAKVGYKFTCYKDRISLIPMVGLYADCGLLGKISQDGFISSLGGVEHYKKGKFNGKNPYSEIEKLEYKGVKNFNRFDWGLHAGLQVGLSKHIYLYGGYDYGMNKVWDTDYFKSKFSSFYLNVGYMFTPAVKRVPVLKEI